MNEENLNSCTKILNVIVMIGIVHMFLYLFAGCIFNKKANHFIYKHVCESGFVFASHVLQLTLRLPLRIYLYKR
jgi:nucleoside recognition membrane protein YjiH